MQKAPKTQKVIEVKRILQSTNPTHNERKFLVHYLRAKGESDTEIFWIIDRKNNWLDYNPKITKKQIASLKTDFSGQSKNKGLPPRNHEQKGKGGRKSFKEMIPFKGDNRKAYLLKPYNNDFLFNANKQKFGILKNGKQIITPYPDNSNNALVNAIFRSIEGRDHILFVIDIDREDLDNAFNDAITIYNLNPDSWTWIKFSGCKGFHLIQKIPLNGNGYDYEMLRERGKWIEDNLGIEIDHGMFQCNRLIRAFSVNFKSGLCSIPVDLEHDNLDDILLRAETLELLRNDKCTRLRTTIKGHKSEIEKSFGEI